MRPATDTDSHRPRFSAERAADVARAHFGIDGPAEPLPSERDQNFKIVDRSGRQFILKISHSGESREVLDFQNKALEHVSERSSGTRVPRVCATTRGEHITVVEDMGRPHFVRMLTYLPGTPLAHVTPHSPELLADLGRNLALIDRALSDFAHPAMHRELQWDLRRADSVIQGFLVHIRDTRRRRLVEVFLERFKRDVLPQLSAICRSVIYNDANDHNVLVESTLSEQTVSGLIDFGDVVHSWSIGEVAVAAAYAMLEKRDPLAAAAHVLAGYHTASAVSDGEIAVLFDLICIRLCMSVTISACQQQQEPDNTYLTVSEGPAWDLLERLAAVPPALARAVFREACGKTPCTQHAAVVSWLRQHADEFGPVLEDDLRGGSLRVLDSSVASPLLADFCEGVGAEQLGAVVDEVRRPAGAGIAVGRYNEPRLPDRGDLFQHDGEDTPESRNVHLGIDLFAEAGAPVRSPLDGTVHGFRDNAAPLDHGPTVILRHEPEAGMEFFTLYGHLSRASLDGLEEGRVVRKGRRIGTIGKSSENGGRPPHLHFQVVLDMLGHRGGFPGAAPPSQRAVWLSLCPDPNLLLNIPHEAFGREAMETCAILAKRREYLGKSLSIAYRRPLRIVKGFRQYLYDDVGRAYLDCVNNVAHVGHCHPRVVRAGRDQMAVLNTNTRYLHENLVRYAERLAALFPDRLEVCFLVCSGSEANELALRMARTHTGGYDCVVLDQAYHGNTSAMIDLSPYKFDGPGGTGAPPHVHKVVMPDVYRGPYKACDAEAGVKYAGHVRDAVHRLQAGGRRIAAFFAESMPGCAGQIILPPGFLNEAYRHVRDAGGLCVADEVQVGFGRVGSHVWAFETQGVVPDIVTLGKPIGNGHPLGAVVTTHEIAESFATGMEYFNTFGGNPVSCAIGTAVLDVVKDEKLQENADRIGRRFLEALARLKDEHPLIGDVRGKGLFLGIELVLDGTTRAPATEQAAYVIERMRDHHILISTDGPFRNVLKIKPPLVFCEEDVARFCRTLGSVLAESCLQ